MKKQTNLVKLLMSSTFRWNVGLLFISGVLVTIGINLWRLIQPYTQPPPRPEFTTATKPKPPKNPPQPQPNPPVEPPQPSEPAIGKGRVVPDIGLLLRDEPTSESGGSTGVGFNAEIDILAESTDGEWLKIRNEDTGESGWVRSGNIDRVAE